MQRLVVVLTVVALVAVMLMASAPNAFAEGNRYGWGANECWPTVYPTSGNGCGYHWGQR